MLSRRPFLAGVGLALAAATTGAAPRPTPNTFYVSGSGDDNADGLTEETAWASIQKVNSALPEGGIALFRCGDTFFGELEPPAFCTLGAYGAGPKPLISMYKDISRAAGWYQQSADIWSIHLGEPHTHGGYNFANDANIGHLLVDSAIKAGRRASLADLTNAWDFYCDLEAQVLYVAVQDNPANLSNRIQAAPAGVSGAAVRCNNPSISIVNLQVSGSGGHGIVGNGADVTVRNCEIHGIGGSYLPNYADGAVRYGNGIENWIGAKRWNIEDNVIAQVYDAAYTCQGRANAAVYAWEDMTFRGNHISECTQSLEFWSKASSSDASSRDSGFKRVVVEGNTCVRAGYSAFADFRPNQAVRVHLLTYDWALPADITIEHNVFEGACNAYSYHLVDPVGLTTANNKVVLRRGTKMQYQRAETIDQAALWQAATGLEFGSTMLLQ